MGADIEDRANGGYIHGFDFLDWESPFREMLMPGGPCANVVTNPPFNKFEQFARVALELTPRKVAMIWIVPRLNAAHWLAETPLARVWLLTPRPSMPPGHTITAGQKPGGGTQDFCWLVWEQGYRGKPELGWLKRDSGELPSAEQTGK